MSMTERIVNDEKLTSSIERTRMSEQANLTHLIKDWPSWLLTCLLLSAAFLAINYQSDRRSQVRASLLGRLRWLANVCGAPTASQWLCASQRRLREVRDAIRIVWHRSGSESVRNLNYNWNRWHRKCLIVSLLTSNWLRWENRLSFILY